LKIHTLLTIRCEEAIPREAYSLFYNPSGVLKYEYRPVWEIQDKPIRSRDTYETEDEDSYEIIRGKDKERTDKGKEPEDEEAVQESFVYKDRRMFSTTSSSESECCDSSSEELEKKRVDEEEELVGDKRILDIIAVISRQIEQWRTDLTKPPPVFPPSPPTIAHSETLKKAVVEKSQYEIHSHLTFHPGEMKKVLQREILAINSEAEDVEALGSSSEDIAADFVFPSSSPIITIPTRRDSQLSTEPDTEATPKVLPETLALLDIIPKPIVGPPPNSFNDLLPTLQAGKKVVSMSESSPNSKNRILTDMRSPAFGRQKRKKGSKRGPIHIEGSSIIQSFRQFLPQHGLKSQIFGALTVLLGYHIRFTKNKNEIAKV
jgi:hypothetical protein